MKNIILSLKISKKIYTHVNQETCWKRLLLVLIVHITLYNLHKHIHTDLYCLALYMFLKFKKGSRDGILTCLNLIKNALKAASDNCP